MKKTMYKYVSEWYDENGQPDKSRRLPFYSRTFSSRVNSSFNYMSLGIDSYIFVYFQPVLEDDDEE